VGWIVGTWITICFGSGGGFRDGVGSDGEDEEDDEEMEDDGGVDDEDEEDEQELGDDEDDDDEDEEDDEELEDDEDDDDGPGGGFGGGKDGPFESGEASGLPCAASSSSRNF
jgi:hypothetical protein